MTLILYGNLADRPDAILVNQIQEKSRTYFDPEGYQLDR